MTETKKSLWLKDGYSTSYPSLNKFIKTDVVIIGAGITGLTTAFLLKEAGVKVIVVEANKIASGTTGNTTAKITSLQRLIYSRIISHFGKEIAHLFADANQSAISKIESLIQELNIDCNFKRLPAYTFSTKEEEIADIESEVKAAQSISLPVNFVNEVDLPFKITSAIKLEDQAHFNPYKYCVNLSKKIDGDGCYIFENSRVISIKDNNVTTENGNIKSDLIVLATQIPFLDRSGAFTRNYPQRSYLLAMKINDKMPSGMYINAKNPIRSISRVADSDYLLVGGESHKTGHEPDTEKRYNILKNWSQSNFAIQSIDFSWSSQDYMSVDGLPFIGQMLPFNNRFYIATGFNKWGMTTATFSAMIIKDLILNKKNPWINLFSPLRLNLKKSTKTFVLENFNSGKRFVKDFLNASKSPRINSLSLNEGNVVRSTEGTVAAYKDQNEKIHSLSPVCTHLGCHVTWNNAEKSWDCPCHGSRYDIEGKVLNGPAIKNLSQKKINNE